MRNLLKKSWASQLASKLGQVRSSPPHLTADVDHEEQKKWSSAVGGCLPAARTMGHRNMMSDAYRESGA